MKAISKGNKISGGGALITLVCFFLPWVMVSCGANQMRSFNAWELAAGFTVSDGYYSQYYPGYGELFLVLIAAIVALVLLYFSWKQEFAISHLGAWLAALAILPLFVLFLRFINLQNDISSQTYYIVQINYQLGFWGTIVGLITMIGGSVYESGFFATPIASPPSDTFTSTGSPLPPTPPPIPPQQNADQSSLRGTLAPSSSLKPPDNSKQ